MIHIPLDESAHDMYMQMKIKKANLIISFVCKLLMKSSRESYGAIA